MGKELPIQKHGNYFVECDVMNSGGEQEKAKRANMLAAKQVIP